LTAYPVDVVDTTGAGDVFHGAYALAIGAGLDVRNAMAFSAATAAMKCATPAAATEFTTSTSVLHS
jgi:sulfofructose kinase